jgi:hypothetical protein
VTKNNLSIQFLNTSFKVIQEIHLKIVWIPRRNVSSEKEKSSFRQYSDIQMDKSMVILNPESMEDVGRFWKNLSYKIFEIAEAMKSGIVRMNDETTTPRF